MRSGEDAAVAIDSCGARDRPTLFALAIGAFGDSPGWSDARVIDVLMRSAVFVARKAGRPIGYVALGRDIDDDIVIEQLLVTPGNERLGVAHRLLAHAESFAIAEEARTLGIVVEADNWAARSFFGRAGFERAAG